MVTDVLGYSTRGVSRNSIDDSLRELFPMDAEPYSILSQGEMILHTNEQKSPLDEKQSQVPPVMDFRDYGIGARCAVGAESVVSFIVEGPKTSHRS